MSVTQELNIADLKNHMQLDSVAHGLQRLQSVDLRRGQSRYDAGVAEARQTPHVVGVPFTIDPLLGLGVGGVRRLEIEDAGANIRLLADAHLALAIKIPHGPRQELRNIGILGLQDVPDVMHARDVALAALLGAREAQQPHDVGVVRVEELARVGPVDAHLVNGLAVFAQVLDVPEDVAPPVLRHRVANVRAQTKIRHRGLVVAPLGHGEPFVQDEALAVEQFVAHGRQAGPHAGQWEVVRVDAR